MEINEQISTYYVTKDSSSHIAADKKDEIVPD